MTYLVIRQDDNGVCYIMADGLAEHEARRLVDIMTARAHKATYFARGYHNPNQLDQILLTHHIHW